MKILATGLSGLVGSRIEELLKDRYEFDSSTENITDKNLITSRITNSDADVVLHLAAKTDVDGCEKDKALEKEGDAWKVNVMGTENVASACSNSGKKIIYISTDFIFDGEKEGGYEENDLPNPVNWYGQTKLEGEKMVQGCSADYIIARIAYPYKRSLKTPLENEFSSSAYRKNFPRKDFLSGLIEKIKIGKSLKMITDHVMTPTFIDDIAFALKTLIDTNQNGVFHVVGSQAITPYETAILIADVFGFDKSNIGKTTREDFFRDKAKRGYNLYLKNDKIGKLGIKMKTLEEGIKEIKG